MLSEQKSLNKTPASSHWWSRCNFFHLFTHHATAQLTPKAVPIAANTAEARFHRNLISLDLFSWVIHLSSIILIVQHSFIHRVFCPQIITDFHRFLNIKDIVIITDFLFGTEIHGFIYNKGTAWLRIDKPRHFVITACFASSRLSLLCGNEPCLYFSIASKLIKPLPSRSQPCLFKAVSIRA